jgi:hypothetical protein
MLQVGLFFGGALPPQLKAALAWLACASFQTAPATEKWERWKERLLCCPNTKKKIFQLAGRKETNENRQI